MLRSETLFGKRETSPSTLPLSSTNSLAPNNGASSLTKSPSMTPPPAGAGLSMPPPQQPPALSPTSSTNEVGSKLIVGPNIKLKGVEITDCDTLVVEGRVEATMDSRVIQIAEGGAFKGSAEIDLAEIKGEFDGELTVREKLVIYATGRVTGKVRYGKVVIEEGGQLSGDIQVGTTGGPRNLAVAKTAS